MIRTTNIPSIGWHHYWWLWVLFFWGYFRFSDSIFRKLFNIWYR